MTDGEGGAHHQRLPLERARHQLVSRAPHRTGVAHLIAIELADGKSRRTLTLVDTVGISEGIHDQLMVRRAMADTLDRLSHSHLVLHLVDACAVHTDRVEALGAVDDEIVRYASPNRPYAILANKMDAPGSADGLRLVRDRYRGLPVLGISALTRRGFREVKSFVFRHLA